MAVPLPDLSIPATGQDGRMGLDLFRYMKSRDALFPSAHPTGGQILVGNGTSYAPKSISGDAALSSAGALTVTKLNGVAPGAFYHDTDAADLTGTVAAAQISGTYSMTALTVTTLTVTTSIVTTETVTNLTVTNLLVRPAASVTPANNGDLVIEATNNTTLTFKFKGSDGTVRTAVLTLA